MSQNTRIARQLVKIARMLVASHGADYIDNVREFINRAMARRPVAGSSGIMYTIELMHRGLCLVAEPGKRTLNGETVDENEVKRIYNDAVRAANEDYFNLGGLGGYQAIEDDYCEMLSNDYLMNGMEFEVKDEHGDVVAYTDEFCDEYEEKAREDTFRIVNSKCLVDESDPKLTYLTSEHDHALASQRISAGGFEKWK